jgi:hypothetical protein
MAAEHGQNRLNRSFHGRFCPSSMCREHAAMLQARSLQRTMDRLATSLYEIHAACRADCRSPSEVIRPSKRSVAGSASAICLDVGSNPMARSSPVAGQASTASRVNPLSTGGASQANGAVLSSLSRSARRSSESGTPRMKRPRGRQCPGRTGPAGCQSLAMQQRPRWTCAAVSVRSIRAPSPGAAPRSRTAPAARAASAPGARRHPRNRRRYRTRNAGDAPPASGRLGARSRCR